MDYQAEYRRWLARASELATELAAMNAEEVEDAFYKELSFGTGGLRGVIGAGTNRMNVYTVAKATKGLADYLNERFPSPSAAVSFDSRIKSDVFARVTASVFAACGVKVYLYPELMPTPCLSFAVRKLGCSAGVMVTASHNPAKYNGYKVYGADGCQITTKAAEDILAKIDATDVFDDVKTVDFDAALAAGRIEMIGEDVYTAFTEKVRAESVLFGDEVDRGVAIVYSPLNGTGLRPVTRALRESGFTNITVVAEQEKPDGRFPTCPYPNPEIREAMALGLETCEKVNADLLLATDPDCDRCGIAVKGKDGYELVTGNETGILLLDFICSQRKKHGAMPPSPVFIKTIVTSDLAERVAASYGVATINVLTGFKFIGEVIGSLEKEGRERDYICGFEESYGYLTGTYVRDKDAVNAALMICEMFAYYKTRGVSLLDRLAEIYAEYGYCLNTLRSYEFDGSAGMAKMQGIMRRFREGVASLGGLSVEKTLDYKDGLDGLPKSDVLKYLLAGGSSAVIRPSGTEPKLKAYISVTAPTKEAALEAERRIGSDISQKMS